MGRPPCCDKVGIKKGPWTPEEDIILVTYIQQHGPGNWSSVPINTGLMRCSKSCRLRWTNYLRPGIKRGNFTPHEEGMIIHLQALLGNKWAAIATYLPQRTDNDIKNYWNTHLKKKLKRFQSSLDHSQMASDHNSTTTHHHHNHQLMSKNYVHNQTPSSSSSSSSLYASSAENISRLLEKWMGSSSLSSTLHDNCNEFRREMQKLPNEFGDASTSVKCYNKQQEIDDDHGENGMRNIDELECILSFDRNMRTCEIDGVVVDDQEKVDFVHEENTKSDVNGDPPLFFLEKWLMDENASQVEGDVEIPPMF